MLNVASHFCDKNVNSALENTQWRRFVHLLLGKGKLTFFKRSVNVQLIDKWRKLILHYFYMLNTILWASSYKNTLVLCSLMMSHVSWVVYMSHIQQQAMKITILWNVMLCSLVDICETGTGLFSDSLKLKLKALCSFKILGTSHPMTECHKWEDPHP